MSTYPTRPEPTTRASALIGKSLVVQGTLTGQEDVIVEGRIEGDVILPENRLTVGPGGHIQGGVKAKEIVVQGSVSGNLDASERIEIRRNAKVVGDLRSVRFLMEDESFFKGNVDTIRLDTPKPAPPKPAPAPPSENETIPVAPRADAKR